MNRRVIFPPPDYWTQPKENTMADNPKLDAIRNIQPAAIPPDTIATYAQGVNVIVSAVDHELVLSLHITTPAPLGDIRCYLGREQILELHHMLDDLLHLTDEQTVALINRCNGHDA